MNQLGADCLSTRWRKRFSVTCLNMRIRRWAQKCALGKQQDHRRNMELSWQCDRSQRSWKHAESPNGERWPATWRCTRPGFGPSWLTAWALSSFQEPHGLGFSLLSYESFSTDPFSFPFSSFAVIFWLERVNFHYPVCSSIDFVSIIYLSVVSLKITIFIFIFLWFTLT